MSPRGYELDRVRHQYERAGGELVPQGTIQLASQNLDLTTGEDREYLKAMVTGVAADKAWNNLRKSGEVRWALSRSARIAGYATLYGERLRLDGNPMTKADAGVVAEIVSGITSRFGGTRGLIERFYMLRKVPAEMYLAAVRDRPTDLADGYWFMSPSEVGDEDSTAISNPRDGSIRWVTTKGVTSAVNKETVLVRRVQASDFYGRIWAPSHQFLNDVDTPMAAITGMVDMLERSTNSIMERLNSRLIHAGVLLVPSEINDAAIQGGVPGDGVNYGTNDKVLRYLIHSMTRNAAAASTGSAVARMPILLKGAGAFLEQLRHIDFGTAVDEIDLKLRVNLLDRIMDSLDQQQSQVQGEQSDRFTAWSRSDEERRITVQPDLESMCHALTRMILWRELRARGWNDARIRPWRIWYDLSASAVKSNIADEARKGHEAGVVNGAFYRKAIGASDYDEMDPEEFIRWVGIKIQNPILATHKIEGADQVDWDKANEWGKTPGPAPDSTTGDPEANPGVGNPGSPGDDSVDDGTPADDGGD